MTAARPRQPRTAACIAMVLAALGLGHYEQRRPRHLSQDRRDLKPMVEDHDAVPSPDGASDEYDALQPAIPMATMLDESFRFDLSRNRIVLLDIPGECLAPGFPSTRAPPPLARYWREHSIRYLACMKDGRSKHLYRTSVWRETI